MLSEILEGCGVTVEQFGNALECVEKKISILCKREPCELREGSYNTDILKLLKSNMYLQYVTDVCM